MLTHQFPRSLEGRICGNSHGLQQAGLDIEQVEEDFLTVVTIFLVLKLRNKRDYLSTKLYDRPLLMCNPKSNMERGYGMFRIALRSL